MWKNNCEPYFIFKYFSTYSVIENALSSKDILFFPVTEFGNKEKFKTDDKEN